MLACLGRRKAGVDELFGPALDVKGELVVDVVGNLACSAPG
jgi:hypothetical protein